MPKHARTRENNNKERATKRADESALCLLVLSFESACEDKMIEKQDPDKIEPAEDWDDDTVERFKEKNNG